MLIANLKRPRIFLSLGFILLLIVTLAIIFHPKFQNKMLLDYVAPHVDSLSVDHIHFTPWSFDLKNLAVTYQGGNFNVERASVNYCLSSLLLLNINVRQLLLESVNIDVSKFKLPEREQKESGVFPGILTSLDFGLGYIIQNVNVDAEILLPSQQSVKLSLTGGGIRPKQQGELNLQARFNTGGDNEYIDIKNTLSLDQLKHGKFLSIESLLNVEVSLAALPQAEHVDIKITATPIKDKDTSVILCNDEKQKCVKPEHISVNVQQDDIEGNNRSSIQLLGDYDGNLGYFIGKYEITANERLIQPYLENKSIPPALEILKGDVRFNITNSTGDITLINNLLVTELRNAAKNKNTPQFLELKNNLRVFLLPDKQLRIVALDAGVEDEDSTQPLTATIPHDLDIPLGDIDTFLHQDNTLLDFELPEIPLKWLDFMIPDYEIKNGHLTGAFRISTDKESTIHISPLKPMQVTELTILQEKKAVLDNINVSLLPHIAYATESVNFTLKDFSISTTQNELVTAVADASIQLAGESKGKITTTALTDINVHEMLAYLNSDSSITASVPKHISFNLQTSLKQNDDDIEINSLDARISKDKNTSLLSVSLAQPLIINSSENATLIANSKGTIATVDLSDIQINWFSAFVPDAQLNGKLQSAEFTLEMDQSRNTIFTANKPLKIVELNISTNNARIIENVAISFSPKIALTKQGSEIIYKDLNISGNNTKLFSGSGEVIIANDTEQSLITKGNIKADLQALSKQPFLTNTLQANVISPVHFESEYSLSYNSSYLDIDKLKANLFYTDTQPRISLIADTDVRIRTKLDAKQSEFNRARGKITFEIQNLTPDPFAEILSAKGITFTEASGKAVLTSDGNSLHIDGLKPFTITDFQISSEENAQFHPINIVADTDVTLKGEELKILFTPVKMMFANHSDIKAVDAKLNLTLHDNDGKAWIHQLETTLNIDLPSALDQPILLPNHKLTSGNLDAVVNISPSGKIDSSISMHSFEGGEEFPLELLEFDIKGQLEKDNSFRLTAPFKTVGKTGESDLLIEASHTYKKDANNLLDTSITGSVFYLNDILDFLNSVTGKKTTKPKDEASVTDETNKVDKNVEKDQKDLYADENAFWDALPYDINTIYDLKQLYYTEFLVVQNIHGQTSISKEKLAINNFEAYFHESPIKVNSLMMFEEGEKPYDVHINASVDDLNLKEFFIELIPDAKPRTTGLVDINFEGFGQTQNMVQLRNNLFFDAKFSSEDGVFRLLDPDSALLSGGTGIFGSIGEGVSYIPTGLFGAGAVPRLVKYIKEVEYDSLNLHLVRDKSKNVQVKKYALISPEIHMVANGGIDYKEGKDFFQSPVKLDAHLNFRGHGAAIMYDLDLLEETQDELGYWEGPKIKFWGNFVNTQSNLDEIISTAGKGAVLGGITRPISGLIGNVKFKWFGKDKKNKAKQ